MNKVSEYLIHSTVNFTCTERSEDQLTQSTILAEQLKLNTVELNFSRSGKPKRLNVFSKRKWITSVSN